MTQLLLMVLALGVLVIWLTNRVLALEARLQRQEDYTDRILSHLAEKSEPEVLPGDEWKREYEEDV